MKAPASRKGAPPQTRNEACTAIAERLRLTARREDERYQRAHKLTSLSVECSNDIWFAFQTFVILGGNVGKKNSAGVVARNGLNPRVQSWHVFLLDQGCLEVPHELFRMLSCNSSWRYACTVLWPNNKARTDRRTWACCTAFDFPPHFGHQLASPTGRWRRLNATAHAPRVLTFCGGDVCVEEAPSKPMSRASSTTDKLLPTLRRQTRRFSDDGKPSPQQTPKHRTAQQGRPSPIVGSTNACTTIGQWTTRTRSLRPASWPKTSPARLRTLKQLSPSGRFSARVTNTQDLASRGLVSETGK